MTVQGSGQARAMISSLKLDEPSWHAERSDRRSANIGGGTSSNRDAKMLMSSFLPFLQKLRVLDLRVPGNHVDSILHRQV
jgi:hypothetical protein